MEDFSKLINPFYQVQLENVENSINQVLYKNRNVMIHFYPLSMENASKAAVHAYHAEALKHWNDDDNDYINSHFDMNEIKPVVQAIDDNVTPMFMFDDDGLVALSDVVRLCDKNNVSLDDFKSWLSKKYDSLKWIHSTSKVLSFDNLFDSTYEANLYQRVFVNWI